MFKGWLIILYGLIIIQIVIGGTTRLTESGLSITEWNVVMGTFPPLNEEMWKTEFLKYQDSPQYRKLNKGMGLEDFKFIYFWEYFHRLWGRVIGLVAICGLVFMWLRKQLTQIQKQRGLIVCGLIVIVGAYGWIMVASGLKERPWVNAYNLAIHLSLAVLTLSYILYGILTNKNREQNKAIGTFRRITLTLIILTGVQLFLGGMVAGMKTALFYPTWPDMNGTYIPEQLLDLGEWKLSNFVHYDKNTFMPAFTQFFHRNVAYLLYALIGCTMIIAIRRKVASARSYIFLFVVSSIQVILGIFVLLHSKGNIPIGIGVLHQIVGIIIFQILFYILFKYYNKKLSRG